MQISQLLKAGCVLTCLGVGLLTLLGCGGSSTGSSGFGGPGGSSSNSSLPSAVADAANRNVPVDSNLVTSNNSFGFDVFNQLVQQNPNQNIFISPTSIALALEIVQNGARGDTLQAMTQALHLQGMGIADVDQANAALQASLISPDPQVQLTIANSLWIRKDPLQVAPAFVQANTTYYGSDVGDLAGAPDNVNAWVTGKTNGKITQIVNATDITPQLVAIVVNAVYFKGQWTQQFDPSQTADAAFTLPDGTSKTCKLMQQSGTYSYLRGSNFQAVRLPYSKQRLSLILVLPDRGTDWSSFLSGLTLPNWNSWLGQFHNASGAIFLPRFQSEYSANLIPSLSALGMSIAFDPQRADFSGIAPETYLSFVRHKTYLKVNEQGTEAAAVTGVGISVTSVGVDNFVMRMDHPFFCAIRDDKTGELLFLGCILDPTAS